MERIVVSFINIDNSEETNNSTATKTNSSSNTAKSRQRPSKAFSVPSCPDAIKSKPEECYQYSIKNIEIDFNQLAKEVIDSSEVKKVAKDLLNQISPDDVITLFEKKVGMTLAEFVLLVIFFFSLPSLMIVGAVFICCWGCGCCCFSKKYHGVATTCHPNLGHYNSNGVFVPSNAATDPSVLTRRSKHEAVNQEAPAVDTLSRRGP